MTRYDDPSSPGPDAPRRTIIAAGLGLIAAASVGGVLEVLLDDAPLDDETVTTEADRVPTSSSVSTPTSPSTDAAGPGSASPSMAPSRSPTATVDFGRIAEDYLRTRPGQAAVAGVNLATGTAVSHRDSSRFTSASIVKVSIVISLLLLDADDELPESSLRPGIRQMITSSDNTAADVLWTRIGGDRGYNRAMDRLGLTDTIAGTGGYWGSTRTSARDQLRVLRALVREDGPLSAARRDYVLDLMRAVAPEQAWGVSAATGRDGTALKNGWLPSRADNGRWVINSIGHLRLDTGEPALLAVLCSGSPSMSAGITTVEHLARAAGAALSGRPPT